MTYQLTWRKAAVDQLTQLWIAGDAETRKQITACCHYVEDVLRKNPFEFGESRAGNKRVGFERPLGFGFRIFEETRKVKIFSVWRY